MATVEQEFRTTDFYLSAYLLSLGHELKGIEKNENNKTTFILPEYAGRIDDVKVYLTGKAQVDPLEYKQKIQLLKSFIYNS